MNLSSKAHFREFFIRLSWGSGQGGERWRDLPKVRKAMDSSADFHVETWKILITPGMWSGKGFYLINTDLFVAGDGRDGWTRQKLHEKREIMLKIPTSVPSNHRQLLNVMFCPILSPDFKHLTMAAKKSQCLIWNESEITGAGLQTCWGVPATS